MSWIVNFLLTLAIFGAIRYVPNVLRAVFRREPVKPVIEAQTQKIKSELRAEWKDANEHQWFNWVILIGIVALIIGSLTYAMLTEKQRHRPAVKPAAFGSDDLINEN
jgi:hypothetical protein